MTDQPPKTLVCSSCREKFDSVIDVEGYQLCSGCYDGIDPTTVAEQVRHYRRDRIGPERRMAKMAGEHAVVDKPRKLDVMEGAEFLVQLTHMADDGMTNRIWAINKATFDFISARLTELRAPHSNMFVPAEAMLRAHETHIGEAIILEDYDEPKGTDEA